MAYENLQKTMRNVLKIAAAGENNAEIAARSDELILGVIRGAGFSNVADFEAAVRRFKAAGNGKIGPLLSGWPAQVVQGVTLGASDEIIAGVRSLVGGTPYNEGVNAERLALEEGQRENPAASMMAQVGAGGAGAGLGLAAKTVRGGMAAATGAGAFAGGATAEGGLGKRLAGAIIGALAGGVTAGVVAGAGAVGKRALGPAMVGLGVSTGRMTDRMALRKMGEAMNRDGVTPYPSAGKPQILPDMGGENLLGLARAAQAVPSEAKQAGRQFLTARAEGQAGRVMGDLQDSIGIQPDGVNFLDALVKTRQAKAATQFTEAFSDVSGGPAVVNTGFLKDFWSRPAFQDGLRRAKEIAAEEGRAFPDFKPGDMVPLQILHHIKVGLQDAAYAGRMPQSGMGRTQIGAIKQTAGAYRDALVKESEAVVGPAYRKALDEFSGSVALQDAFEAGGEIMKADSRLTAKEVAAMSAGEKDAFLVGAVDKIRSVVASRPDGADAVKRMFGSPEKRAAVRNLFPDDNAFGAFARKLEAESGMRRTQDVILGGSPTARIQAETEDLGRDPFSILSAVFSSGASTTGAVASALRLASANVVRRAQGMNNAVAGKLANSLFEPDPAKQTAILRQIEAQRVSDAARKRSPVSQGMGGLLGVQYPMSRD